MTKTPVSQDDLCFELIGLLADAQPYSIEMLAERLGVTKSSVAQLLEQAGQWGVVVENRDSEEPVRWLEPINLLDVEAIRALVALSAKSSLSELLVLPHVDSTNQFLLQEARRRSIHGLACLAEVQTEGRGRRGNKWASPLGNLYLSVGWETKLAPGELGGLSLAVGVALARAIAELGLQVSLKWPNDVELDGRKLCGILIETQSGRSSGTTIVVGVGMNIVNAPQEIQGNTSIALHEAIAEPVERSHVCALVISHLLQTLIEFETHGFEVFRSIWNDYHAMRDQAVVLFNSQKSISGRALGVDHCGAIQLDVDGVVQSFSSGSIRLRADK